MIVRSYSVAHGVGAFNPGRGDTRFAPVLDHRGEVVPTLYAGADEITALLETVFHDVHHTVEPRLVLERALLQRALVWLAPPRALTLVDLRDQALTALGLTRAQLVATTSAHYPCTRTWAAWLHRARPEADGLLWHSRQSELSLDTAAEAMLLFGDRVSDQLEIAAPGVRSLFEGEGRLLIDELAELLDAEIVPLDG